MGRYTNNLGHRIYRNDLPVEPGQPFESDAKFDKDTFPEAPDPVPVEVEAPGVPDERLQRIEDVTMAGRALSTAALRDRLDPETETTVKGTGEHRLANQPSAGGPPEIVREDVSNASAPPPPTAEDPEPERPLSGPVVAERLGDVHIADSAPNFASSAAEQKAAELDVDPSSIEGSGRDGAITVADVEKAADSD